MMIFILQILTLICFAGISIYSYYFWFGHIENFDGYLGYIIPLMLVYSMYKGSSLLLWKKTLSFSAGALLGYFLIHLLILCCLFFGLNQMSSGEGISLFVQIVWFLLLPLGLIFICYNFWKYIFSRFSVVSELSTWVQTMLYIVLGMMICITLFSIASFLGLYNIYTFIILVVLFMVYSYSGLYQSLQSFFQTPVAEIENHNLESDRVIDKVQPYLLSSEFFFIIITFILSINLISIVRPMPIGWDDLWVYMNYPNLIAQAGDSLFLWWMYAWQIFNGIGFLFQSNTQAFFLNNVGWILSAIFIAIIAQDIFKNKKKKTLINIPLLLSAIFIALPMVVFQQAKDMKLDPSLFAISIAGVYYLFVLCRNVLKEKQKLQDIKIWLLIIGLLIGFMFSIKFTWLLTIIASFGILSFTLLGWWGVLSYLALVTGIFSYFDLWSIMNVNIGWPYIHIISLVLIAWGVLWIIVNTMRKKQHNIGNILTSFLCIWLWILLALMPWFGKNVYQIYSDPQASFSVTSLLSGKWDSLEIDYSKIYNQEQLQTIQESIEHNRTTKKWTTQDEDLGRYFWYETGLNNYLKLPFNLTMQVNQKWEFTDISYIFLALLFPLFLFLPYRKEVYILPVIGVLLCMGAFLYIPWVNHFFTELSSSIHLPLGYIYLFFIFLLPVVYLLFTLRDCNKWIFLKILTAFTSIYVFLWAISAYGIVWYGIVMYFLFLLFIGFGVYYMSMYHVEKQENLIQKYIWSVIIFILISIYFFFSVFPHGMNNLKWAGFKEFKAWQFSQNTAIFSYHQRYLTSLSELNLWEHTADMVTDMIENHASESLKNILEKNISDRWNISQLSGVLRQIRNWENQQLAVEVKNFQEILYTQVLYPKDVFKNSGWVYRIGTFLKFFISENTTRMYEDSLLTNFDTYFSDKNEDVVLDRMQKMWLDYLLVDLNAATIDNDPRQDLTRRYESLLTIFPSNRLELIWTDSICLQIGLEKYKKWETEQFMFLAWVNHESGSKHRSQKLIDCYQTILDIYNAGEINTTSYSYLLPIQWYLQKSVTWEIALNPNQILQQTVQHGSFVLFKIR